MADTNADELAKGTTSHTLFGPHINKIQAIYARDDAAYSPFMPAALMTGHHFSISALCNRPSASGVC
jgi:hypothetical protein